MELLSISELAKRFKVSRGTVYKWIAAGLPAVQVPGSRPMFNPESVDQFLAAFERPVDPESSRQESPTIDQGVRLPPGQGDHLRDDSNALTGVYQESPGSVCMIAYQSPGPNGITPRRIRQSSGTYDPHEAASIRKERIRSAWINAPHSTARSRNLKLIGL